MKKYLRFLFAFGLAISLAVPFAVPVSAAVAPALEARWMFDEGTGIVAEDLTDNDNDATLKSTFGWALSFDGVNDYVEVPDSAALDGVTDLSVELWFKPSITHTAGIADAGVLVSKYGPNSFQFVYAPGGYLYLWVSNGMAAMSSPVTLNADTWYHLAATFDSGTNISKIFVNGANITASTTTQTMTTNNSAFLIGARPSPEPTYPRHFLEGAVDEVRISNAVRASFNLNSPLAADAATVALWHFDEGAGQTTKDFAGSNDLGTLGSTSGEDVNDPVWVASDNKPGPQWITGQNNYGNALRFDGLNDYALVADSASLEPTSLTLEAWVRHSGSPGAFSHIVSKVWNSGNSMWSSYGLYTGSSGQMQFYVSNASGYKLSAVGTGVWDGNWHHVAGTYDTTTNEIRLYIDKVLVSGASTVGVDNIIYDTGMFYMGTYRFPETSSWGSSGFDYAGDLDELRIWGSGLDVSQLDDMTGPTITVSPSQYGVYANSHTLTYSVDDAQTGVKNPVVLLNGGSAPPSGTILYPGVYTLEINASDYALNTTSLRRSFVVYDATAGFVTGGGWIASPAGAFEEDPSFTGKASFGFVSKYQKGATIPTGETQFKFEVGTFSFYSNTYDWLVVNQAGGNAQFKGTGTINGAGSYKFMLWAADGTPDTFRIRIWSETAGVEADVYDNGTAQTIGGGNIVVHKAK